MKKQCQYLYEVNRAWHFEAQVHELYYISIGKSWKCICRAKLQIGGFLMMLPLLKRFLTQQQARCTSSNCVNSSRLSDLVAAGYEARTNRHSFWAQHTFIEIWLTLKRTIAHVTFTVKALYLTNQHRYKYWFSCSKNGMKTWPHFLRMNFFIWDQWDRAILAWSLLTLMQLSKTLFAELTCIPWTLMQHVSSWWNCFSLCSKTDIRMHLQAPDLAL